MAEDPKKLPDESSPIFENFGSNPPDGKLSWPELLGVTAEEAERKIKEEKPEASNFAFKGYYKNLFGYSKRKMDMSSGLQAMWLPVVLPEQLLPCSFITWTMQGLGWQWMLRIVHFMDNFFASFMLGWSITTFSGVCAYPFDTVRRRMMLTSGQETKYRNFMHALREIIRVEGFYALFRGVRVANTPFLTVKRLFSSFPCGKVASLLSFLSANMLYGVAGAGVLAEYDRLHQIVYRPAYSFESQSAFNK